MGSTGNLLVLPSALQALPVMKLKDDPWEHKVNYASLLDSHETLRCYHAKLDLMESSNTYDYTNNGWQIENIDDWELKRTNQGLNVFLKVTWFGGISSGYTWMS